MLTLNIATQYEIHTEQAETLEELKRIVLNGYNVRGFVFFLENDDENATTFHKFFKGIRVSK